MNLSTRIGLLSVVFSLITLTVSTAVSFPAAAASSGPQIDSAMVQVIQGEADGTSVNSSYNDFHALKIIIYRVSPNDTRVWTNVPANAMDVLVWTPTGEAASGSYGWESSGPMAGSFFVVIPSTFNYSSGEFLVHISYSWTQPFSHGKTTVDVSEPNPFLPNGTLALLTFVLKGYNVTGDGLTMVLDDTGSMNQYPDKDLYVNVTNPSDPSIHLSVTITKPKTGTPWALYLGAVAVVAVILFAFAYARYLRPTAEKSSTVTSGPTPPPTRARPVIDSGRRRELVDRKKELLTRMESVKDSSSKGTMPREEAEKELAILRKEFKSVRNELNRITRASHQVPAKTPLAEDTKRSDEFELVLASLAKIDEDYEKGRLPESSYRSLRGDYLEKASKLMDEGDTQLESVDPAEAEKVKLMEAIIALDEEHGRGEIEARVYEDLRDSYKNELAAIMNKEAERD